MSEKKKWKRAIGTRKDYNGLTRCDNCLQGTEEGYTDGDIVLCAECFEEPVTDTEERKDVTTLKEKLEEYIKILERRNDAASGSLCRAVARIAEGIAGLDTTEEQIAAFKGFEPRYDRVIACCETREVIVCELKGIVNDGGRKEVIEHE